MNKFSREEIFIVTGASSGIGQATAMKLVENGATVVAIARNYDRLLKTKKDCKFPEQFNIEIVDLNSKLEDMTSYLKCLKEKYGKFSGIAYCAGAILLKPSFAITYKDSVDLFNINYFVPLMMVKSFLDKRICNIGNASVVVVASSESYEREKGLSIYSGSKAALQASMSVIAKEVASKGIRVNTVSPSDIKTPMTINEEMNALREGRENMYPLGFGEPDDVANMIIFLLGKESKWITGHDYIVDCATF